MTKIVYQDLDLQELIKIYKEATKTLEILKDWDRADSVRLRLLRATTPETLKTIHDVKKRLEDMGVHLLITKN